MAKESNSWPEFQRELKKESLASIYIFFGEEDFLVREASKMMQDRALAECAAPDFNFDSYNASDCDVIQVKDTIETLPMMASHRVVVIKEVGKFKDKDWDSLMPVLESPVDSTLLILTGDKLDKRKKATKVLMKMGQGFEFNSYNERQVEPWVKTLADREQLQMSAPAAKLLLSLVGSSLSDLEGEIRKLSLYKKPGEKVSEKDVAQVVSRIREESVFDLTKAIAGGDRAQALIQLVQLLDQGQNEIAIVYLVARHFRILALMQEGLKAGLRGPKLAAKAGVPSFFVNQYVDQAKGWSSFQLKQALIALADTDRALKSSPLSSHIWLENFILRVCSYRKEYQPAAL